MIRIICAVVLAGTLISCSIKHKTNYPVKFASKMVDDDSYNFFVIGDWGRKGNDNQQDVANAMKICADLAKPKFIISTGDNFYERGITSTEDTLWFQSFENVYKDSSLHIKWYPILGNHDYNGNTQAQIDYSQKSARWTFPNYYYTFLDSTSSHKKIRFVFIDTSPFVKHHMKNKQSYPDIVKQDTLKQWMWIDSVMSHATASNEDWKIVIGHHPVYSSNPKHGDTKELLSSLKPRLDRHKVQAYLSGHDHDLQHQKPKDSYVDYFVSGAGSEVRPTGAYEHTLFAQSVPGFALISIKKNTLTLLYIDKDSNVIYKYSRKR